MNFTRVIQFACLLVAGFLFINITGVKLPTVNVNAPAVEAATAPEQVIFQTAVINRNPGLPPPAQVIYVTATPAANNVPVGSVEVVIIPAATPLPDGVGIDEVMTGPIVPAVANDTAAAINADPETRVECTRAEWEQRSKANYPAKSGCTIVVDAVP